MPQKKRIDSSLTLVQTFAETHELLFRSDASPDVTYRVQTNEDGFLIGAVRIDETMQVTESLDNKDELFFLSLEPGMPKLNLFDDPEISPVEACLSL